MMEITRSFLWSDGLLRCTAASRGRQHRREADPLFGFWFPLLFVNSSSSRRVAACLWRRRRRRQSSGKVFPREELREGRGGRDSQRRHRGYIIDEHKSQPVSEWRDSGREQEICDDGPAVWLQTCGSLMSFQSKIKTILMCAEWSC